MKPTPQTDAVGKIHSAGMYWVPESFAQMLEDNLRETAQLGAEIGRANGELQMQAEAYLLDRNNLAAQLEVARSHLGTISRLGDPNGFMALEALAKLPTAAQNLSAQKPIAR